jgi:hypothetical protein
MKKVFIYLLFFSYTTMLLKPVMPSVADLLAHTFWYSHHMATVHFENGKYHVHYQYMEESKKNFPEKNSHFLKNETTANDHLASNNEYDFSMHIILSNHFTSTSACLPNTGLTSDYPPPRI